MHNFQCTFPQIWLKFSLMEQFRGQSGNLGWGTNECFNVSLKFVVFNQRHGMFWLVVRNSCVFSVIRQANSLLEQIFSNAVDFLLTQIDWLGWSLSSYNTESGNNLSYVETVLLVTSTPPTTTLTLEIFDWAFEKWSCWKKAILGWSPSKHIIHYSTPPHLHTPLTLYLCIIHY